jgi:DNA polymerase-3 subunit gamma/tau
MPSQALYRKWRSQTFQELIGQEAVVQTLKNALQSGRIAHAYLFCGPRGTGKTSAARLLAKTVNCQNPQNSEPCNACLNCREITENHSLDVIEIDAASNRGIDEIRDLRDKVNVRPATSKYKVYVLDEAHMLTSEACNALLKTLEEPPPYVIFVLATTEAQRMLPTIVSRCQRFDFKRHTFRNTVAHLKHIAAEEGITLENGAAELLARAAGGGMRDALSLLDQAMASQGETVTQEGVQQMLGLADPHLVRELVEHIAALRGADGLHLINRMAEAGADLRQLSAQVAEYWRAMMLAKAGADIVAVLDRSPEDAAEVRQLADAFALDELSLCARTFSQNDVGARAITIPQLAVELAFIDCLHLHRQRSGAGPSEASRPAASVAPPAPRPAPAAPAAPPAPRQTPAPTAIREAAPLAVYEAQEEVESLDLDTLPPPAAAPRLPAPQPAPALLESPGGDEEAYVFNEGEEDVAEEPTAGQAGLTLEMVSRNWEMVKKACKTRTPKLAALLNSAAPVAVTGAEGNEVVLQVEYDFHYKKLLEPESRNVIEWALKEILQVPCRCRFLQKDDPVPASTVIASPAARPPRPASPPPAREPQAQAVPPTPAAHPLPAQNGNGHSAAAAPGKIGPAQASAPPADPLEAKVRQDVIVSEIMRTYGAKLVEWKPLGEEL